MADAPRITQTKGKGWSGAVGARGYINSWWQGGAGGGGRGRRRQVSDLLAQLWLSAPRSAAAAYLQRMYIDLFVYHFFCKHYSLNRAPRKLTSIFECIVLVTAVRDPVVNSLWKTRVGWQKLKSIMYFTVLVELYSFASVHLTKNVNDSYKH